MKIALYLGSFNPFHKGHLFVIKTALDDFKMDKVIIVPSMQNPWKKEKVLNIDKRTDIIHSSMVKELFCVINKNKIKISAIEKELISPYYSYATLHALKNKYCNDKIFVLVGEDTMKDIPNWMHGGKIIEDYDFLIVDRPKNTISSTEIRNKIKNNEPIEGMVSNNVINLIKKYYK